MADVRGFDWVHDLKRKTGKPVSELIVLSKGNDPFFSGSPGDRRDAEWFAAMWQKEYNGQTGIHIRRVHYLEIVKEAVHDD